MIETSVARDERGIPGEERDTEERREERDGLYDVLAALPFAERIELIERMAERMGVQLIGS
jgi:hypothetical protein